MVGKTLGHYEIVELLGAGGMGEVYRARDTKLERDVAIKVLPEDFASDQDRLARFEREAKLLASLNHANIATIHGLEDADGVRFIAMELVEGETLGERIARSGRIEVNEALEIARQIAEALEAAHDKGVIHRDLKPANVKVTPDGKVKVLDFGLAKVYEADGISSDISHSPTMAVATQAGVILGTAAYMSPEQARGRPLDKRTDIWAFGCVLFEMLSGEPAYDGETVSDTMAAILKEPPDWDALPDSAPAAGRRLLRRCLEKDPANRLRDVGDARIEIREALHAPAGDRSVVGRGAKPSRTALWWTAGAAFALGALASTLADVNFGQSIPPQPSPPRHLAITLSPDAPVEIETWRPSIALSPDGTRLVYVANRGGKREILLRRLGEDDAQPIPGTEDGYGPFFSPDGASRGVVAGYELKTVALSGGAAVTLARVAPVTRGATWGTDGTIVFTSNPNGGLVRLAATGEGFPEDAFATVERDPMIVEDTQTLTNANPQQGEYSHRWPTFVPGGGAVLFTVDTGSSFDNASIAVLSLNTGAKKDLFPGGTNAVYSPTGHIVFAQGGSLYAVPFDRERLELTGPRVRILDGVLTEPGGAAHFALSRDGSLVYVPGERLQPNRKLVWVDREGNV
ncbi:MAG: protein kinase, partial [Acidobacteriota bacterium]